MEFSIFVWVIEVIIFIIMGLLSISIQKMFSQYKLNFLFVLGIPLLMIMLLLYLPYSTRLWIYWNNIIYSLLDSSKISNIQLWKEVWYTIVFFRNLWPALLIAGLMISLESTTTPYSNRYRMMKTFAHNKIHIMIGMILLYLILSKTSFDMMRILVLNIVIYTAIYYWRFGFATVLYILRRGGVRYEIGFMILIIPIILAGDNFLLPLIAMIGIGISDIWMDYHQRNASTMLFSLDFS